MGFYPGTVSFLLLPVLVAVAAAQSLAFISVPNPMTAGESQDITWQDPGTTVSLILKKGSAIDLQTIATIASGVSGGEYVWTPPTSLEAGDDYALQIQQDDDSSQTNYFGPFTIEAGAAPPSTTTIFVTVTQTTTATILVSQFSTDVVSYASATTTIENVSSGTITITETETVTSTITGNSNNKARRTLEKRQNVDTVTSTTTVEITDTVTSTQFGIVTASRGFVSTVFADSSRLRTTTITTTATVFTTLDSTQPSGANSANSPNPTESSSTGSESTSNSSANSGSGSGTNVGAIAGGVVGGVVGLAIIGGLIWYLVRRKEKQKRPALPEMQRYAVEPNF